MRAHGQGDGDDSHSPVSQSPKSFPQGQLYSPKPSPHVRIEVPSPGGAGTAPQSYNSLPALDRSHRYVITGTLQQSLFGIVKLAFDRVLKIQVAIKISRRERAAIQQTRSGVSVLENVRREASVMRYLSDRSASAVALSHGINCLNLNGQTVHLNPALLHAPSDNTGKLPLKRYSSRASQALEESQQGHAMEDDHSVDEAGAGEDEQVRRIEKDLDPVDLEGERYICKFIDELEDEYFHYLISEFVPAGDLYSMLTSFPHHRLSEPQARTLFRQIALGVRYLHNRNVAHLDISLENICLDQQENCKIIDFGVAALHPHISLGSASNYFVHPSSVQFSSEQTNQTREKDTNRKIKRFPCESVVELCNKPGKLRYMSPELFSGTPWDAFANDIFSLGVILYSLLTGRPPFQQADNADVWFSVIFSGQWLTPAIRNQPSAHVYTHLSMEALDLINKILKPQSIRLSLDGILHHPWMLGSSINLKRDDSIEQ